MKSHDLYTRMGTEAGHWMIGAWKWMTHSPFWIGFLGLMLLCVVLEVVANWKLVKKTGNSGIYSLLFYLPCVQLLLWLALAFGEWPKRDA